MSGIFISYRRGQAGGYAGRLADELARRFGKGQVFRDIEAISAGSDFVAAIDTAVATCDALIVIITPGWADAVDEEGNRRLENPEDFVRLEIESALRRGVWVIPVLVGGAAMPPSDRLPEAIQPLARRQAHEIRDASWEYNVDQLVSTLERKGLDSVSTAGEAPKSGTRPGKRFGVGKLAAAVGGVLLAVLVLMVFVSSQGDPDSAVEIQAEQVKEDAAPNRTGTAMPEEERAPSRTETRPPTIQATPNQPVERTPRVEENDARLERARREIAERVAGASQAEIDAFSTLDEAPLWDFYDGEILEELLVAMEELRANGFYSINTLHGRSIHSISIAPDFGTAEVEMTERWSSEYRNDAAGACFRVPEHEAPQKLHLYRAPDGWKIDAAEHYSQGPDPVPC